MPNCIGYRTSCDGLCSQVYNVPSSKIPLRFLSGTPDCVRLKALNPINSRRSQCLAARFQTDKDYLHPNFSFWDYVRMYEGCYINGSCPMTVEDSRNTDMDRSDLHPLYFLTDSTMDHNIQDCHTSKYQRIDDSLNTPPSPSTPEPELEIPPPPSIAHIEHAMIDECLVQTYEKYDPMAAFNDPDAWKEKFRHEFVSPVEYLHVERTPAQKRPTHVAQMYSVGKNITKVLQTGGTTSFQNTHPEKYVQPLGCAKPRTYGEMYGGTTKNLSVDDIEESYYQLETFSWAVGDTKVDNNTIPMLRALTGVSDPIVSQMMAHNYFRYDSLRLKFVINSSTFNAGRAMVVWDQADEFDSGDAANSVSNDWTWKSTRPHVMIDAGVSSSQTMEIPWNSVQDFINLTEAQVSTTYNSINCFVGAIKIFVITPWFPASGDKTAGNINISVYYTFTNPQFGVQIPRHDLWKDALSTKQAIPTHISQVGVLDAVKAGWDVAKGINEMSAPQASSSSEQAQVAGDAHRANATEVGTKIKSATETIVNGIEDVYAGVKTLVPFDSPSTYEYNLQQTPLCYMGVPRHLTRLAGSPCSVFNQNLIGTNCEDQMDLRWICSKPAIMGIFAINKPICFPVSPTALVLQGSGNAANVCPTHVGYAAMPFNYWRGALKYHIDFIIGFGVTARFQVSWIPEVNGPLDAMTLSKMSSMPITVLDVSENRSFEFIIPYVATTPFKRVSQTFDVYALTAPNNAFWYYQRGTQNGAVVITVANDTSKITPNANVNYSALISVAGAEDFELACPRSIMPANAIRTNNTEVKPLTTNKPLTPALIDTKETHFYNPNTKQMEDVNDPLSREAQIRNAEVRGGTKIHGGPTHKLQMESHHTKVEKPGSSQEKTDDQVSEELPISILPEVRPVVGMPSAFGESWMHLKNLLARPTLYAEAPYPAGGSTLSLEILQSPSDPNAIYGNYDPDFLKSYTTGTLLKWFSTAYSMWAGSLRWTIAFNNKCNDRGRVVVWHNPRQIPSPAGTPSFFGSLTDPSQNIKKTFNQWESSNIYSIAESSMISVEVPYYAQTSRLDLVARENRQEGFVESVNGTLNVVMVRSSETAAAPVSDCRIQVFQAIGDDFRFVNYVGPPVVDINMVTYSYSDNIGGISLAVTPTVLPNNLSSKATPRTNPRGGPPRIASGVAPPPAPATIKEHNGGFLRFR